MPRDASGEYQQPPDTAAVPNLTASSSAFNLLITDLGDELTGSLARDGTGGMLADLNMAGFSITNSDWSTSTITKENGDTERLVISILSDSWTLYDFGCVNDGITDNTTIFETKVIPELFDGNFQKSNISVPVGEGFSLDGFVDVTLTGTSARHAHLRGESVLGSKIICRSSDGGIRITKTSILGDFSFQMHHLAFLAGGENIGTPFALIHSMIGTDRAWPEIDIEDILLRTPNPDNVTDITYFGACGIHLEGWFKSNFHDIRKEAANPGASWAGHSAHDGHDISSDYYGQAGILLNNCYGARTERMSGLGGRYGILHAHDPGENTEGGTWDYVNSVGSQIGFRYAADDFQPGLILNGGHLNARDKNIMIGGPVFLATVASSTSTVMTLKTAAANWSNPIAYTVGTYVVRVTKLWRCKGQHTSAASGSDGPPEDVSQTRWAVVVQATDTVYVVGGTGAGENLAVSSVAAAGGFATITTAAWSVTPANYSRIVVESIEDGGAQGVQVRNLVHRNSWDWDRNDGLHGIASPVYFDLTGCKGAAVHGNEFQGAGPIWNDWNSTLIKLMSYTGYSNEIRNNKFTCKSRYAIENPDNGTRITELGNAFNEMTTPFSNGDFTQMGNYASPESKSIYTGGMPPVSGVAGTDTTVDSTRTYLSEIFISRTMPVTGITLLQGTDVTSTGLIRLMLFNSDGYLVAETGAVSVAGSTDSWQRYPLSAMYAAIGGGKYFIGLQANAQAATDTVKFRAHDFGDFGANYITGEIFGSYLTQTISAISQASPGEVTHSAGDTYANGDTVRINSVRGMSEVNGTVYTVTRTSATKFTIGVDTSAYTSYVAGGTIQERATVPTGFTAGRGPIAKLY